VFTGLFDAQVLVLTSLSLTGLKRYAPTESRLRAFV